MNLLVLLLSLGLLAAPAWAQPQPIDWDSCHIHVDDPVDVHWKEALEHACAELAQRQDLDADARVDVHVSAKGSLLLHAALRDGRSTAREVDSVDGLNLTLAALLVLPLSEPAPTLAASAPATPTPQETTPQTAAPAAPQAQRDREPTRETQQHTDVEKLQDRTVPMHPDHPAALLHLGLSGSVIGHVWAAPTYVGAGFAVGVTLRLGSLLFVATPRWEAEQASLRMRLPDFEMHNFGLAGFLGLRVWDDYDGAAEIGAGALLLAETQSYREEGVELDGTVISGQLAGFARLLWGEGAGMRWSMSLELSLAPRRLVHRTHVRDILPPLPSVGVGIGFGGHWESS